MIFFFKGGNDEKKKQIDNNEIYYEDILPINKYVNIYSFITNRIYLFNFMKSNIFKNYDGNTIDLKNKEDISCLNYMKIEEYDPYINKKYNEIIYNSDNIVFSKSCYPIKFNEKLNKVECGKNSIEILIKKIGLTIQESLFMLNNIDQKSRYIDSFREIKYYEYIRDNIIKTFNCPNFVIMYTYFISNNNDINFNKINKIKRIGTSLNYINYYNNSLYNNIIFIGGGNQKKNNINFYQFDKSKNALQSDNFSMDNSELEKMSPNLFNKSKIILQFEKNESETNNLNSKDLRLYKYEKSNNVLHSDDDHSESIKIKKNIENIVESDIDKNKNISTPQIDNNANVIQINNDKSKKDINNKKNISKKIKKQYKYSGQIVYILTESPTYNLYEWTLQKRIIKDKVNILMESGYYPENVWQSILFQLLTSMYVLFKHNIAFHDFTIEDNIFIKKININETKIKCWKYIIDGIEYYIPNYGFILLIDTNYKDITYMNQFIPTHKIYGSFFNDIGITKDYISELCIRGIQKIFSPNIFMKSFINGIKPPDNIMFMLEKMQLDLINSRTINFDNFFIKHMGIFVNNRIGSYINDIEKQHVKFGNISSQLTKGKIVAYQQNFNTYVFVMFLRFEHDLINTHKKILRTNAIILTRQNIIHKIMFNNKNTIDVGFIEIKVPVTSLFEYVEIITQYTHPFDITLSDNELFETYMI